MNTSMLCTLAVSLALSATALAGPERTAAPSAAQATPAAAPAATTAVTGPATAAASAASAAPVSPTSSAAPSPADTDKALYALGVLISRNLEDFQLSPAEFERVRAGLNDGFKHRASSVDLAVDTAKVQALRRERLVVLDKKRHEEARAYLDEAAHAPGAKRTGSGLVMIALRPGDGESPVTGGQVTVNYQGKLIDGTVFDSSAQRGQPATFSLDGVIPCWSEALPLMKVGGKARIVCPAALAYGPRGAPPKIGPDATLDFEVELIKVAPPGSADLGNGARGGAAASGAVAPSS